VSAVLAPPEARSADIVVRHPTAVLALARQEGRRLVRHPIFVVGVLLSVAAFEFATWLEAPVLHRDDVLTSGSLLALAGATFLAANLGALRTRRLGTEELFGSTPTDPAARTLGHLVSVAWAAAAALLVAVVEVATLLPFDPVGVPSILELLMGPLIVALFGVLGIGVARWLPSVATAPVALVALGGIQLYLLTQLPGGNDQQSRTRWLAPWVPLSSGGLGGEPPPELVIRPIGWHLLYLAGLAVTFGAMALARHEVRGRRMAALAAGFAVVVLAGAVQTLPPDPARQDAFLQMALRPEAFQVCETRGAVRYCAYPAYAPWIDRWEMPIGSVLGLVPATARPEVEVRQTFSNTYSSHLPEGSGRRLDEQRSLKAQAGSVVLTPGTRWGRNQKEGDHELGLAIVVASWSVGLPRTPADVELTAGDVRRLVRQVSRGEREDYRARLLSEGYGQCSLLGQARAVVALWLAGQATPGTERALRTVVTREGMDFVDFGGGVDWTGPQLYTVSDYVYPVSSGVFLTWPRDAAHYAVQLLDRPSSEVAAIVSSAWKELVDPGARMDEAVRLLELRPYPTLEQQLSRFDAPTQERLRSEVEEGSGYWEVPCR
jgi:hypothetical protein